MDNPADRFHSNMFELTKFVYYLVEKIQKSGSSCISLEIIIIAQGLLNVFDKKTLIEGFIRGSYKFWESIRSKDENILNDHSEIIFGNLPANYADGFKDMLKCKDSSGKLIIDEKDRETIWKYLHPFVKQSIRYVHEMREPYSNDQGELKYHKKFFCEDIMEGPKIKSVNVDIKECAIKWDMKLKFPRKS